MPVPTHGSRCRTLFCRPSRCGDCSQEVFHWACTCGSHVLFDALGDPWPRHQCTRTKSGKKKVRPGDSTQINAKARNVYTYGVLSSVCAICGKTVRNRDLDAHKYYTHGIGAEPGPKVRPNPATENKKQAASSARKVGYTSVGKPLVACPWCGAKVLQKNLHKHLSKKCPAGK